MAESQELKDKYKNTVQLPRTDFPMRANLPETEPKIIEKWEKQSIYKKIMAKNASRPKFVMPDGPPYANGGIHMGTSLNKVLKDIVIKYKSIAGFRAAFIPGWDCHGLPIEQNVSKALGAKRKDKTNAEIRELCRTEARKWIEVQKGQFIRLGVLADWQNPYLTMQPEYEAEEVRELSRMLKTGVLYRGNKPVYWCPTLQTALAEAEVEYHQHKSPSIYVKFPMLEKGPWGAPRKNLSFVIWTTTPWTLPANLGLSVHPEFDYEIFKSGTDELILASKLKEAFEADTGLSLQSTGLTFKGAALEKLQARHPFYDRASLVVVGEHVTADAGTGVVHTAPGHGQDDYQVGLKYGMAVYSPLDAAAKYTKEVPEYEGVFIFDANKLIVERLKNEGKLLGFKEIEHSYPHNWRTKTPLIFRATPQWFVRMDDSKHNIREKALSAIDHLKFTPAWGERRLRSMVERRPDWCLSRQRIWGVPIPVYTCKQCEHVVASSELFESVADKMEKNGGMEAYYSHSIQDFLGSNYACEKCGNKDFAHSNDILDVWFDSGACHAAVQKRRDEMAFPADIYLEGSDQHRGWFQTSLLSSIASTGQAPYKGLVTHGFVNDMQGRKMSKSLGNYIDPQEIIKQSGAEIIRLWVAHEDYGQDLTCGPESFTRMSETYRRFRNTFRFLLGNLAGFDPAKDLVPYEKLTPIDQWALTCAYRLIEESRKAYDAFEFYKVYHLLNNFFTVELSSVYMDVLKDRLYTAEARGNARMGSQTVFYHLLKALTPMMAPLLSFLSEETYSYLPGDKKESVFLEDYPTPPAQWNNETIRGEFEFLLRVRSDASKLLEDMRREKVIGASLEASLTISAQGNELKILQKYAAYLNEWFIVSQVELADGPYGVKTGKAPGEKCVRCWNYDVKTNTNPKHPGTCPKCWPALDAI